MVLVTKYFPEVTLLDLFLQGLHHDMLRDQYQICILFDWHGGIKVGITKGLSKTETSIDIKVG